MARDKQMACIVTGTVKSTDNDAIYVNLWDAFNPHDPLNDDTKEWLTRNWTIQVSQTGINKIHPKYILFEIGEELSLSRNVPWACSRKRDEPLQVDHNDFNLFV